MYMVSFDFLSHMYIHMDKPSVKLNIILYPPSIPGHHRFSFASYKTVDTKYICDGMVSWHIWLGECSSFLASSIKLESTIIYIMSVSIPIFVCCGVIIALLQYCSILSHSGRRTGSHILHFSFMRARTSLQCTVLEWHDRIIVNFSRCYLFHSITHIHDDTMHKTAIHIYLGALPKTNCP